jgi:hypothetical protein
MVVRQQPAQAARAAHQFAQARLHRHAAWALWLLQTLLKAPARFPAPQQARWAAWRAWEAAAAAAGAVGVW